MFKLLKWLIIFAVLGALGYYFWEEIQAARETVWKSINTRRGL